MLKHCMVVAIVAILLAGCASVGKPIDPKNEDKIKTQQANFEKNHYSIVFDQQVGGTQLLLRKPLLGAEDELVVITRGKTVGLSTLMVVGVIATYGMSGGQTFTKDQLKGKVLEPIFKNPTLTYAKPIFETWLNKNVDSLAPKDKPVTRMTVSEGRFTLTYAKLVGKEAYELGTDLTIGIKNHWNNDKAFTYECHIKSVAKPLSEWQADNYKAVDDAIKNNIQTCITQLDNKKGDILRHLS